MHRHPHLLRFLLVTLTVLLAGTGAAWSQGSMELTVVDEKGKGVRDVEVTAVPEGGTDVVATATTNKKGLAKADFPAAGFYTLTMAAKGFPEQTARIEIRDAMNTTFTATLLSAESFRQQQSVDAFNAGVTALRTPGKEAEALASFEKAVEINPELADAYRLIAILATSDGNLEKAEPAVNKFLEMRPDGVADVALAAHYVFRNTGKMDQLGPVREALIATGGSLATDVAASTFNEGVGFLREEKKDEARERFIEATLVAPNLSVAHRSLAALEFNEGNYEAALPHLEALLGIDPKSRDGNRMAFFTNHRLGNPDAALTAGKAWAAADDNAIEEISSQAVQFFENNEFGPAQKLMELALGIEPDSAYGNYTMGRVLAGAGNIPKAKEHLRRFLELAPDHPEASSAQAMLDGL